MCVTSVVMDVHGGKGADPKADALQPMAYARREANSKAASSDRTSSVRSTCEERNLRRLAQCPFMARRNELVSRAWGTLSGTTQPIVGVRSSDMVRPVTSLTTTLFTRHDTLKPTPGAA